MSTKEKGGKLSVPVDLKAPLRTSQPQGTPIGLPG
jgi:hypothetical protein